MEKTLFEKLTQPFYQRHKEEQDVPSLCRNGEQDERRKGKFKYGRRVGGVSLYLFLLRWFQDPCP
jgi:hypothetical protein